MSVERIDAHHHLWKYSREEYPWMLEGMESIRRDFLIDELKAALRDGGVDGVITVQARQSVVETEWLIELASRHKFMRGIVGWVPLTRSAVRADLERYTSTSPLKGVRHVLHDEPDDLYMLRKDFNQGISLLKQFGLRYDILIFERHLPQTIEFVDRHPNQMFIVDHIAKPRIKERLLSPWREHMRDLAKRPNVYCKLSGLVTEADWRGWTESDLRPYIDVVLECFGPKRLMFGSDFPVSLVACTYKRWMEVVEKTIIGISAVEREWVFGRTATEAYNLSPVA